MKMYKYVLSIILIFAVQATVSAQSLPIDLTAQDAYVVRNFDKNNVNILPGKDYITVKANPGKRPVMISKLGFEGLPRYSRFIITNYRDENFTIYQPFTIDKNNIRPGSLGLSLGRIGHNWEIYLNGQLIDNQLYLDEQGQVRVQRQTQYYIVELPESYIKNGDNLLTIRVVGDPSDDITGLSHSRPCAIDYYSKLTKENREKSYFNLITVSVYLFAGIYHLLLFLYRRKEKYNLILSMSIIGMAVYLFCQSPLPYDIFTNIGIVKHIEYLALVSFGPLFLSALNLIIRGNIGKGLKIYNALMILVICINQMFYWETRLVLLTFWKMTIIPILIYSTIVQFIIPLMELIKESANKQYSSFAARMEYIFFSTVPGNLIIGWILLMISVVYDVVAHTIFFRPTITIKYTFLFFVLGTVFILANRFMQLHKLIEDTNIKLEQIVQDRTAELQEANKLLVYKNEQLKNQESVIFQQERMAITGDLVAGTAHEISTPLLAISVGLRRLTEYFSFVHKYIVSNKTDFNNLLKDPVFKSNYEFTNTCKESIFESIERIRTYIRNLKSFIKFQEAKSGSFDINKGLDLTTELLNYKKPSNISIKKEFCKNSLVYYGNGALINQVFMNLLSNAIESIPRDKEDGEIVIKTSCPEDTNYKAIIEISDNGKGIPEPFMSGLFTERLTTKDKPFGVGLALSKNILDMHKGTIEITSKENIGTTVKIFL